MPPAPPSWTPCPALPPVVAPGDVHVWWGALDGAPWWEPLAVLLGDEERERAARLRLPADRLRTLAAWSLARALLAGCGAGRARALAFARGAQGKPRLAAGPPGLEFNLAHSGEAVLVAVASARAVGVDVEQERPGIAAEAAGICSPAEATALAALAPARRSAGFFACWTRKEAYLKARGDGLAVEPGSFDVAVDPDAPPRLLATRHDPADAGRWALAALPAIPGHAASVAALGGGWRPHCWRIQEPAASEAWLEALAAFE